MAEVMVAPPTGATPEAARRSLDKVRFRHGALSRPNGQVCKPAIARESSRRSAITTPEARALHPG
jgi:hypothetical protein